MIRVLAWLNLLLATLTCVCAWAGEDYAPRIGQSGKDVIWVPTSPRMVDRMLDMAGVKATDRVVDLGSGDGRLVIAAARRGATALGIEYNPEMVELARRNALRAGVADRARFVRGDVFETGFDDATVVTMYLLTSLNVRLRPAILRMRPGTRVVSHAFDMGDWTPDETARVENSVAYLWIVPANVAGRWRLELPEGGVQVEFDQTYQRFSGRVSGNRYRSAVADPYLRGADIRFTVVDATGRFLRLRGRVDGVAMQGVLEDGEATARAWTATRIPN